MPSSSLDSSTGKGAFHSVLDLTLSRSPVLSCHHKRLHCQQLSLAPLPLFPTSNVQFLSRSTLPTTAVAVLLIQLAITPSEFLPQPSPSTSLLPSLGGGGWGGAGFNDSTADILGGCFLCCGSFCPSTEKSSTSLTSTH